MILPRAVPTLDLLHECLIVDLINHEKVHFELLGCDFVVGNIDDKQRVLLLSIRTAVRSVATCQSMSVSVDALTRKANIISCSAGSKPEVMSKCRHDLRN